MNNYVIAKMKYILKNRYTYYQNDNCFEPIRLQIKITFILVLIGMEKLKSSIYDVASRMTDNGRPDGTKVMGEQVPFIYQLLEKELLDLRKTKLKNQQIPILTRDEYIDVIRNIKCTKDTFEDDDFEIATKFLHNIGMQSFFNIVPNSFLLVVLF